MPANFAFDLKSIRDLIDELEGLKQKSAIFDFGTKVCVSYTAKTKKDRDKRSFA